MRGPAHAEALAAHGCAVCGIPVCAECDHGHRYASLCAKHARVPLVQGWAEVVRTSDDAEAELVASWLRARDLDAHVLSQKDHAHMISVAGMAIVRVLVPPGQYESARSLLDRRAASDTEG